MPPGDRYHSAGLQQKRVYPTHLPVEATRGRRALTKSPSPRSQQARTPRKPRGCTSHAKPRREKPGSVPRSHPAAEKSPPLCHPAKPVADKGPALYQFPETLPRNAVLCTSPPDPPPRKLLPCTSPSTGGASRLVQLPVFLGALARLWYRGPILSARKREAWYRGPILSAGQPRGWHRERVFSAGFLETGTGPGFSRRQGQRCDTAPRFSRNESGATRREGVTRRAAHGPSRCQCRRTRGP